MTREPDGLLVTAVIMRWVDDQDAAGTPSRVERRRKWIPEEKAAPPSQIEAGGGRVTVVERRHRISENWLYKRRSHFTIPDDIHDVSIRLPDARRIDALWATGHNRSASCQPVLRAARRTEAEPTRRDGNWGKACR